MADGYTNPVQINSMNGPVGMPFPAVTPPMAPISTNTPTTQSATTAVVNSQPTAGPVAGGGLTTPGAAPPQFNPVTGENLNPTFFQSGGMLDVGLGALQTLGNLWNSFQQIKLAKDQFSFQKQAYNTNLANQEKTYNTSLQNREESRGSYLGRSAENTAAYVKNHSL
jgi:hypothetical protein